MSNWEPPCKRECTLDTYMLYQGFPVNVTYPFRGFPCDLGIGPIWASVSLWLPFCCSLEKRSLKNHKPKWMFLKVSEPHPGSRRLASCPKKAMQKDGVPFWSVKGSPKKTTHVMLGNCNWPATAFWIWVRVRPKEGPFSIFGGDFFLDSRTPGVCRGHMRDVETSPDPTALLVPSISILSRDPSFQATIQNPRKHLGF